VTVQVAGVGATITAVTSEPVRTPPVVDANTCEKTCVPAGGAASERSGDRALELPDRDGRQGAGQQGRALIRLFRRLECEAAATWPA